MMSGEELLEQLQMSEHAIPQKHQDLHRVKESQRCDVGGHDVLEGGVGERHHDWREQQHFGGEPLNVGVASLDNSLRQRSS